MNDQKSPLTIILTIVIILLLGVIGFLSSSKKTEQAPFSPTVSKVENDLIKTYSNPNYGYSIQYPSFMDLNDVKPDFVSFTNRTCESNTQLCITGVSNVSIEVSDIAPDVTLGQKLQAMSNGQTSCEVIKIFPLPENFNQDELLSAIRCGFLGAPKQSPSGYSYTLIKNNRLYTITMNNDDSVVSAYVDGTLSTITRTPYDPLGDMMMRTFKLFDNQPQNE